MPRLALADVDLHFEVTGAGPPLVLIAGMVSDSASWQPVVPRLAGHFTVIRPDNRSTGRTVPWDAPISIATLAADCLALLDHLGHDRAHLVGHSMGGLIAMQIATDAPDRVRSLTLAASAPMRLARNMALFETLLKIRASDGAADLWLRAFFPWLFDPCVFEDPALIEATVKAAMDYPHAQSADAMRHQLGALSRFKPGGLSIACPAQALLGEADLLMPEALARDALQKHPGFEVRMIAGAGHSVHWDAPEPVADHIISFAKPR